MKIEIVLDPSKPAPSASLVARMADAPTAENGTQRYSHAIVL
jgi:hypothetical protein